MSHRTRQYVICINAEDSSDLEVRKLYERQSDALAEQRGLMRIVDESGEDYLYPAEWFIAVELPSEVARILAAPSRRRAGRARANPGLQRAAPSRRR